jgi:nucleoid-associated protein YgaU
MNTKHIGRIVITFMLALGIVMLFVVASFAETKHPIITYEHDPMDNPEAAVDIVVNPDAVYGYSPNPESERLGRFAELHDWTNDEEVAEARKEREEYHKQISELYPLIEDMLGQGKNVEEIARAVSKRRNEIRLETYRNDPEGLATVKKSNLDKYGNEEGATPEYFYEETGSWQAVIEKALSTNPGMDACVGLYDEYYYTYDIIKAKFGSAGEENVTYTVESGDCLWNISVKFYGDGTKWRRIYEENKDLIKDPSLIYKGQEFVIPDAA